MYIDGPFDILISGEADKLNFSALSESEQKALTSGIAFDPDEHNLYRFFVSAREKEAPTDWNKRQFKKKSFKIVDRVYLQVDCLSAEIRLMGCHPPTTNADGQSEIDFEAHAVARVLAVGEAGIKLNGPIKNTFRKRKPLIVCQRTDRHADWIFSKDYVSSGSDLKAQVTCVVDRVLDEDNRRLKCHADFKAGGRSVERKYEHVALPL